MRMRIEQLLQQNTFGMSRFLRRGVALVLAVTMVLPTAAMAAPVTTEFTNVGPILQVKEDEQSKFPKIEIETNFVRTEFGTLTDTVEIALRVGPSAVDDNSDPADPKPIPVSFHSLAVNLQYNPRLFKAVSWDWVGGETPKPDLDLSAETCYSVDLPAKKDDTLPVTGAVAQCGIVSSGDAPDGVSDHVKDGDSALLFFKAEVYNASVEISEMTTLAVIRFRVVPELRSFLSIEKDGAGYKLNFSYDDDANPDTDDKVIEITSMGSLKAGGLGPGTLMGAMGDSMTAASPLFDIKKDQETLYFADEGDYTAAWSPLYMAVDYVGESKGYDGYYEYYYVPGFDPADITRPQAADAAVEDPSTTAIELEEVINKTKKKLVAPKTLGDRVLAYDPDSTTAQEQYSYTSNLIPAENITFPVVSEMSFADSLFDNSKYTTIVYVDWDNTLLGTQIVPKKADIRQLVSDHVAKNYIYHDADDSEYGLLDLYAPTEDQVKSTARKDSYRGKYPYSRPMDEETGAKATAELVSNGGDYPLTNKLDYTFFKRPMAYLADDGTVLDHAVDKTGTWVQKTEKGTTDPLWDADAPFAYGWAKCTQATYADTWTTLGSTGELNSYKASDTDRNNLATVKSTDVGFEFADLETGFQEGEDTIFLKAVYEPGDDIAKGYQYRLYTTPAYNKLNYSAAAAGGAYSVTLQYERATTLYTGNVQGVNRIHTPTVRQMTTTDYRWKLELDKGVNHNLSNPSVFDASEGLTETTYTLVNVENSEIMDVQLVLSARQNKVDYFLMEAYGGNFVAGTQRSAGNFERDALHTDSTNYLYYGRGEADFTIDNYNYYALGDSSETDTFFDVVKFNDKEGSHGFVLYGTLNSMLQKATQYNNALDPLYTGTDTVTELVFNQYLTSAIMSDANLRADASGTEMDSQTNQTAMRKVIRNAAAEAAKHKDKDDEADYWDATLDCARLTYHQLQWFVIDPTKLLSPAEADDADHKLAFCRLHAACAALAADTPESWDQLLEAADKANDSENPIAGLTIGEVGTLSRLRSNANGDPFATTALFQDAFIKAVNLLKVTSTEVNWVNLQYAIINLSAPNPTQAARAQEAYWWYDGAANNNLNSWSDLVTAADHANNGYAYADGVTRTSRAKLASLENAFENAKSGVTGLWIKATDNLMTDYDSATDTAALTGDYADFLPKLLDAFKTPSATTDWNTVQTRILTLAGQAPADGNWWRGGAYKVTDVETLLKAASEYLAGSSQDPQDTGLMSTWENLTYADLYKATNSLHFRAAFDGTKYYADDDVSAPAGAKKVSDFKAAVLAYIQNPNARTNSWPHLQYYLIHGTALATNAAQALNRNAAYYWWENNGEAEPVDFTLDDSAYTDDADKNAARADALAAALCDAAYRSLYNGNTVAFDDLTAAVLVSGRLIAEYDDSKNFADQTKITQITDTNGFIEDVVGLYTSKIAPGQTMVPVPSTLPSLTWEEIQESRPTTTLPASSDDFWWKRLAQKPAQQNAPEDDFATLTWYAMQVALADKDGGDAAAAQDNLRSFLTEDVARNMGFLGANAISPVTAAELAAINWSGTNYKPSGLGSKKLWNSAYTEFTMNWYQVQYAIIVAGKLDTAATATTAVTTTYNITPPSWVATGGTVTLQSTATLATATTLTTVAAVNSAVQLQAEPVSDLDKIYAILLADPEYAKENREELRQGVLAILDLLDQLETQEEKAPEQPAPADPVYDLSPDAAVIALPEKTAGVSSALSARPVLSDDAGPVLPDDKDANPTGEKAPAEPAETDKAAETADNAAPSAPAKEKTPPVENQSSLDETGNMTYTNSQDAHIMPLNGGAALNSPSGTTLYSPSPASAVSVGAAGRTVGSPLSLGAVSAARLSLPGMASGAAPKLSTLVTNLRLTAKPFLSTASPQRLPLLQYLFLRLTTLVNGSERGRLA